MSGEGDIKAIARYTESVGDGKWYVEEETGEEGVTIPGERKDYEVIVHNGRPKNNSLSIHKEGFFLRPHTTKVSDFYNEDEVKNVYYPEIEAFLKIEFPEASKMFIFDHTRRCSSDERRKILKIRPHANGVHNDYTSASGIKRVRDLFPEDAENLLKKRFMIINVWKPVLTVETFPLAFVDAHTVALEEYLTLYRITKDRVGEVLQLKYNDKHQWYYFPKMERSEVAVLKKHLILWSNKEFQDLLLTQLLLLSMNHQIYHQEKV